MAGRVVDGEAQARELDDRAVGERLHVVGLGPVEAGADERHHVGAEPLRGVGQQVGVGGVDVGGDVARAAHRGHGERVVEVPVGEDHGDGFEAALREQVLQAGGDADAGVHDHALGSGTGRQHIAVRAERIRHQRLDEQPLPLPSPGQDTPGILR